MGVKLSAAFITFIALFIVIAGCIFGGASDNGPTATPVQPIKPSATPTITPTVTVVPEPSQIHLAGTGQQITNKFHLDSGLSEFAMRYTGTSNFIVWLRDGNGQRMELLAKTSSGFAGSEAASIAAEGDYALDVSAIGDWSIDITQPRPVTAQGTPVSLSDKGNHATQFFRLEPGTAKFHIVHNGSANFIVWLDDVNGNHIDAITNMMGSYDGTKSESIAQGGVYLLDVDADGNWKIDITQ